MNETSVTFGQVVLVFLLFAFAFGGIGCAIRGIIRYIRGRMELIRALLDVDRVSEGVNGVMLDFFREALDALSKHDTDAAIRMRMRAEKKLDELGTKFHVR